MVYGMYMHMHIREKGEPSPSTREVIGIVLSHGSTCSHCHHKVTCRRLKQGMLNGLSVSVVSEEVCMVVNVGGQGRAGHVW